MNLSKIGKFIALCRKNKNLTQESLAEQLNITNRAVSKWERGLSLPDVSIMLDLCKILDINVNELLCGEKIDMKDYKEKNEELLLEFAKQDELKNKKLMITTVIASIFIILFYLCIVGISAYTLEEGLLFGIIITISTLLLLISMTLITKLELDAGYHQCKNCNEKFIPSLLEAILVPHIGYTRYLKCPKCHKRTMAKKVMSK